MKNLGFVFIAVGLALIVFVIMSLVQEKNKTLSPIPEKEGVKVIFVSPAK